MSICKLNRVDTLDNSVKEDVTSLTTSPSSQALQVVLRRLDLTEIDCQ